MCETCRFFMITKPHITPSLFSSLSDMLNQSHPLYKLADKIDWSKFDTAFAPLYCQNNGRPAKPIRLMCGLLILKHLRNLSDESLVDTLKDLSNYALMTAVWLEEGATSSNTDQPPIGEWGNLGPDGANLKSIIQDLNRIIPGIAIGDGFILDNKSFPKSVSFATKYKKSFQHWFDSYVKEIPYYNVVYQDLGEGYTQICIYSHTEGYNTED